MKAFHINILTAATLLVAVSTACAHHGQEFFLVNDAKVQAPGHGLVQSTFSFSDEGYEDSLSLSPGIMLGVFPRMAVSVLADFADEAGKSWDYRSIEPSVHFDLTPKNLRLPMRFGVSFSYQFARGSGEEAHEHATRDLSGQSLAQAHETSAFHEHPASAAATTAGSSTATAGHDHSTHDHTIVTPPAGEDTGPDALTPEEIAAINAANAAQTPADTTPVSTPVAATAPPAAFPKKATRTKTKTVKAEPITEHNHAESGVHSHEGSIHNHDENLFSTRFVFEIDLTPDTLLIGNLISSLPEGGSASWGYALGLRQRLHPQFSVGAEALGDFDRDGYHEVLGAIYWEPVHHVILKVGAGTGLTETSPDATVRAGLVWMF